MTVQICPTCDIAGCHHIRDRAAGLPSEYWIGPRGVSTEKLDPSDRLYVAETEATRQAEASARDALDSVTTLHRIIAEIRDIPGIGGKPMLSELPDVIRALVTK